MASWGSQPARYSGTHRAGGNTARHPRTGTPPVAAPAAGESVLIPALRHSRGVAGIGPRSYGASRVAAGRLGARDAVSRFGAGPGYGASLFSASALSRWYSSQ